MRCPAGRRHHRAIANDRLIDATTSKCHAINLGSLYTREPHFADADQPGRGVIQSQGDTVTYPEATALAAQHSP